MLLMIHVSSSLAILKSKEIIEPQYKEGHVTASRDLEDLQHVRASKHPQPSTEEPSTAEKLKQFVSKYWIMAGSGNPQFIVACFSTTTASGVICAVTAILQTLTMGWTIEDIEKGDYDSDYKKSMPVILLVQFIGVILGSVAPLSRCLAPLSFNVSIESISSHMKVSKVETYWTQKLDEWKDDSIPLPFRSHKRKVVLKKLKSLILIFCIKLQKGVVVACKIMALIPFYYMLCYLYCVFSFKWLRQKVWNLFGSGEWGSNNEGKGSSIEKLEKNPYVLQLEAELELADRTLKGLESSLHQLIRKSERKQPTNLMKLIEEKSTIGFQGAQTFENNDCCSLVVVNLTTIVVTLRKTKKVDVDSLLKSVREGLEYVTLVENATDDYVSIQKVAEILWQEVDICHEWLGISLKEIASRVTTTSQEDPTLQIVQLFSEKAKNKIKGVGSTDDGGANGDYDICAESMSRITETIIADHNETHKKSFDELISSRLADIMAACLTKLPKVIAMKCHTREIEKREESVRAAAKLLGESKKIIKILQDKLATSENPVERANQ